MAQLETGPARAGRGLVCYQQTRRARAKLQSHGHNERADMQEEEEDQATNAAVSDAAALLRARDLSWWYEEEEETIADRLRKRRRFR